MMFFCTSSVPPKIVQAREDADSLRERIRADIARQPAPELADMYIVRSLADLDVRMPPYVSAYLSAALANRLRAA